MRALAIHTHGPGAWAQVYRDLVHYGVLVDTVTGTLTDEKLAALARKRDLPILFCAGTDAAQVLRVAGEQHWPVIVLCADLGDWLAVSLAGLVRSVDLVVFASTDLANNANRNVQHVVVTGPGDAGVLRAVLYNLVRHHKQRGTTVATRLTARRRDATAVTAACQTTHGDAPSCLELNLFLDATHTPRERALAVKELPCILRDATVLARGLRARA